MAGLHRCSSIADVYSCCPPLAFHRPGLRNWYRAQRCRFQFGEDGGARQQAHAPSSKKPVTLCAMNWLQRFVVRLAARIAPEFGKVLRQAGGTVEQLAEQNSLLRYMAAQRAADNQSRAQELREAMAMAGPGPWQSGHVRTQESAVTQPLRESIADLELALEDRGWQRELFTSQFEFSRWGIQQIILLCRLFRIKNPLIQRGILVSAYYVFGRGVEVTSQDDVANQVLQDFFDDPRNAKALGKTALMQLEEQLYTDGNIFWCLFTSQKDGQVLVRTIDAIEIQEIICDPDDSSVPWFYKRAWTQANFDLRTGTTTLQNQEAWYIDLQYPQDPPAQINGKPVMKDATGQYIRVHHRKCGGLGKWHFGCPLAYAAIDWARAYKERLEDYATIVKALTRFGQVIETKGGAPAIASFKHALATTVGPDTGLPDHNPPAVTGAAFVTGPGNKITAFDGAGKTPPPEEGRRLAHMVYMVFGLPETFFSDVSVGTLATATSLDRPTELKFLTHQQMWIQDLRLICQYVLEASKRAPAGRIREAREQNPAPQEFTVQVTFPPILEGDVPSEVNAVVAAMAAGIDKKEGCRLLMQLIGVQDPEVVLEAMFPEDSYDADQTKEPEPEDEEKASERREALVLRACNELKGTLARLQEVEKPVKKPLVQKKQIVQRDAEGRIATIETEYINGQ